SVYLDPARISLAPLERIDVIVLPASVRVYLVTLRQRSTETASQVGVATGEVKTANYRGAVLRRCRSGLRLSLVADDNNTDALEVTNDWSRAHLGVAIRRLDHARPRQFEGTGAWSPFPGLTLAGDARHAEYSRGRSGKRAHLAAGLILPAGLSLHGDLAWAHDLRAPLDSTDGGQRTVDASGALDRKSTRLNSSHVAISYAVFCLKKKNITQTD